ncbi:hypothetical protein N566_26355 [Streptomycetaceae bacterium MP113-05]|nr:hypothetical protein N566_26355 [Streptomycetaceae bacterium MP113-05]
MTGAVVLVGVAVSAVTGCVTVREKAEPHRSPGGGPSREDTDLGGEAEGQAPDMGPPAPHEEASRPSPGPSRTEPVSVPDAPEEAGTPPGATGRDVRPEVAAPVRTRRAPTVRPTVLPGLPGDSGVCDLGGRYGGWRSDSTPREACELAYGR